MDTQTSVRRHRAVLGVALALAFTGCDSVYTIHSIAAPSDQPSAVPDLSGLWVPDDGGSAGAVLRIAAEDYDIGQCRNADLRWLGTNTEDEETVTDELCFVPVAGHLVAQFRTTGDVQLYQQYLFKFDQQSMSFCDAIWADLLEWSEAHPKRSAAHGLEFVRRGWEDGTQIFVTSSSDAIRAYLEPRLPKQARACDEDSKEGPGWVTYTRMTPPRQPDVADAAEASLSPPD